MPQVLLALTLGCISGSHDKNAERIVTAIRTAYEDNRAALSASGRIRFQCCDGKLSPVSSVEGIDAALRAPWQRRSGSVGLYVFDGAKRRYENLYSPEDLLARRVKSSSTSWESAITSDRLLTDGESTFMDSVDLAADDKTVLHTPNLRAGSQHFFRLAEGIPLQIGNPDPPEYDLGKCLSGILEGHGKAVLAEVDEEARLGDSAVVKIKVELPTSPNKLQVTFWVDPDHGAIPLQTRVVGFIPHTGDSAVLQFNNSLIKWSVRGWLPYSWTAAQGDISKGGAVPTMFVREFVISEAHFDQRPDHSVFALEFPKEYTVSDSDRLLAFGSRRVWSLNDFSPRARASARPLRVASPGKAPNMPSVLEPGTWWPALAMIIGFAFILAAGAIVMRRIRSHD